MEYKIPIQYRGKPKKELDSNCLDFGAEKITKIKDLKCKGQESKLYDITVENTHNFICNGMVVHNCLVIFAWLVAQPYFKEMTDDDVRKRIYEGQSDQIEADMAPFGFLSDGIMDSDIAFIDSNGDAWRKTNFPDSWMISESENRILNSYADDAWNLDEYGDQAYMWEYQ